MSPDQKPKHKLQLNKSLKIGEREERRLRNGRSMDPSLRIHIKPTHDSSSIIIEAIYRLLDDQKLFFGKGDFSAKVIRQFVGIETLLGLSKLRASGAPAAQ